MSDEKGKAGQSGGDATGTRRSRALFYTSSGGFDKVAVKEVPIPEPKENEIRIAIKFAGINFADILRKQGSYSKSDTFPFIAGTEASGFVDALGSNVHDFQVGDKVLGVSDTGCFSDFICLDTKRVLKLPANVFLEDAACLFVNYVTAYDLLFKMAHIQPGQILLLPQASGGVGNAVMQLLKGVPDVTVIALASESKHQHLRSLGVQYCIDYRSKDYVAEVRKISPKGVDVVLDSLNGDDSVNAFNLLRPYGRVIHYGAANLLGEQKSLLRTVRCWWKCLSMNSIKIITTNRLMGGYHLAYVMGEDPEQVTSTLQKIVKMLDKGEIKPKIDSIFPLTKGKDALLRIVNHKNIGKVLLSTDAEEVTIFEQPQTSNAAHK